MSNIQVFKKFALGLEAVGNSVKTVNVEGSGLGVTEGTYTILYSYSTPIAYRSPHLGGQFYFDSHSYSVTTSKQRTQAKRELPSGVIYDLAHEHFRKCCRQIGADLSGARS